MTSPALGFHEATVTGFSGTLPEIHLTLDGACSGAAEVNAELSFLGVTDLRQDGQPIQEARMAFADGEVLTLEWPDGLATLVVEWNDFATRRRMTSAYTWKCDDVLVVTQPS
jgi:hypothetical protein